MKRAVGLSAVFLLGSILQGGPQDENFRELNALKRRVEILVKEYRHTLDRMELRIDYLERKTAELREENAFLKSELFALQEELAQRELSIVRTEPARKEATGEAGPTLLGTKENPSRIPPALSAFLSKVKERITEYTRFLACELRKSQEREAASRAVPAVSSAAGEGGNETSLSPVSAALEEEDCYEEPEPVNACESEETPLEDMFVLPVPEEEGDEDPFVPDDDFESYEGEYPYLKEEPRDGMYEEYPGPSVPYEE